MAMLLITVTSWNTFQATKKSMKTQQNYILMGGCIMKRYKVSTYGFGLKEVCGFVVIFLPLWSKKNAQYFVT
jgi:hypothetical protein